MVLSFTTGKIQWDLYRSVLGDSPTPIATRLIWAENVQRYCYLEARTRADRIYINARLERCQPITHDTIIIQRTTAVEQPRRIIAHLFSPDSFGYPIQAENNTSYLVEIEDMHLKFVLGILNSKFIDFHISTCQQQHSCICRGVKCLTTPRFRRFCSGLYHQLRQSNSRCQTRRFRRRCLRT